LEGSGVSEEIGDTDQEVAKQRTDLFRLFAQPLDVIIEAFGLQDLHAPLYPAVKGRVLVGTEIMPGPPAQQGIDVGQRGARSLRVESPKILNISEQPLRNILDRKRQVDKTRGYCALRHLGETRTAHIGALGNRQPALFLDRFEAERSVSAAARKHNTDCVLPLVFRQRAEEEVDRRSLAIDAAGGAKVQPPLPNGQDRPGRKDIDMLRLDRFAVARIHHRHLGCAAEDPGQHAFAVGIEMRNHDKRHAIVLRHGPEKRFERLDPARRSADARDPAIRSHNLYPRVYLTLRKQTPIRVLLQEWGGDSARMIDQRKTCDRPEIKC
jgi:hypothetical protein